MRITLNGIENFSNIITFTGVPTILTVQDTGNTSYGWTDIKLSATMPETQQDYQININGYTVNAVYNLSSVSGQNFYMMTGTTTEQQLKYIGRSIVKAISNLKKISADFNVYMYNDSSTNSPVIRLKAKTPGKHVQATVTSNLPYVRIQQQQATDTSELGSGRISNTVNLDIYRMPVPNKVGSAFADSGDFVTRLQKNFINGSVSFDLSTIFTSLTDYNSMSEFYIKLYTISDDSQTNEQTLSKIYAVPGYLVNQGKPYIHGFGNVFLMQNVARGQSRTQYNSSLLYLYYPKITLSLLTDSTTSLVTLTITYRNTAGNVIDTAGYNVSTVRSLYTAELELDETKFNQSAYIDVTIPGVGDVRYNVIKPLKATDERECQRIYWTNSYGGTSFMDFTGDRTEQRKTDVAYYQKNIYDYYTSDIAESNRVYDKSVEVTVTLKTHNIMKDGTWQLFDLQNSLNAWTVVNGRKYSVTITDLKISESSTVNGIYTGEITYTYSQGDSF